ncbi:hypothetical protein [Thermosulfidibacter takaii]|uniref:hypothetical protein n=1 Tax=Thermosulfidibacter takaii TaxID=412593 RepID=UPI000839335E|nr:hypothetical protein [Thermosulfidibacter takaii]
MDLSKWIEEVKEKGFILAELGKLTAKRASLSRKVSKFHCRIGERVDYLDKMGRSFDDDDILKGLIQELRNLEKEIEEIEQKIEALKKEQAKEEEARAQETSESTEGNEKKEEGGGCTSN